MRATATLGGRGGHRPASAPADGAALALLSEILIGDSEWTMEEVRRLISMRELAELGRWRPSAGDDEGTTAP